MGKMQKYKKSFVFIFRLVFLFCLTGCAAEGTNESLREKSAWNQANEDLSEELVWEQSTMKVAYGSLRTAYDTTSYKGINYCFEAVSMELEEKEAYIKQIGDFLDEMEHYHKKSGNETALSVYVGDCITNTCLPGEIYINTDDVYLLPTFFKLFLSASQEELNVEQAYGMTARIYEKLEIGEAEREHTDAELAAFFSQSEHLYLLDFTLPMLETEYFEEETAAYAEME